MLVWWCGWTMVCLTDLVRKVTAPGLRCKSAVPGTGAQSPAVFSSRVLCLRNWRLGGQRPRVSMCSHPPGSQSSGVNEPHLRVGGLWLPSAPPRRHREVSSGGPAALPCPVTLHLGEKSNVHLEKALFALIVFKATPFQRLWYWDESKASCGVDQWSQTLKCIPSSAISVKMFSRCEWEGGVCISGQLPAASNAASLQTRLKSRILK